MIGADPPPELLALISELLEMTPNLPVTPNGASTWEEVHRSDVSLADLYGSDE